MIDAVLLDVGGVLVVPTPAVLADVSRDHGGRSGGETIETAHYHAIAAAEAAGDPFGWSAYRRVLLTDLGIPDERHGLADAALDQALRNPSIKIWNHVLAGARPGLQALARTGVPLGIVSNADGTVEASLAEIGLVRRSDDPDPDAVARAAVIIDSAVVGVDKPDPAIFAFALDALGTAPERTVHVGDTRYADVVGARAAGIRPLHLDPVGWCSDTDHEHVRTLSEVAALVEAEGTSAT